ncbi:hypothetical protein [Parasedimentitalea maritima]|uniref:D-galactarate dehydratase n=1 Tax=Parasedimentitalea maritima TaxID=2578117 RepID=A0A6A4RFQ9_9RHOB|nr:hypothetical protein [Zongyanglinia marina]KAE9629651.1 hypothetical protein GP644_11585 [Zongyanglinia marina]
MCKLFVFLPAMLLVSACDLSSIRLGAPDPVSPPLEVVDAVPSDPSETGSAPTFGGTATTVAGLGDPTVPGLWMETPLVSTQQMGRVRSASGTEVTLTLRPIAGEASSGSRLSIDAMRALGAPLTELIEVQVSAAS